MEISTPQMFKIFEMPSCSTFQFSKIPTSSNIEASTMKMGPPWFEFVKIVFKFALWGAQMSSQRSKLPLYLQNDPHFSNFLIQFSKCLRSFFPTTLNKLLCLNEFYIGNFNKFVIFLSPCEIASFESTKSESTISSLSCCLFYDHILSSCLLLGSCRIWWLL